MAGDEGRQPDLDGIEERFAALCEGRLSREEADRWAMRWITDDALEWDDLAWWALDLLAGVDLPALGGGHLHGDDQLRGWLDELRHRRRTT
ncbi:hypothetical protein [Kitasatospora sp. NPDC097643]|uniref:hypothetical protein n=1 Tax=Kitasatospora sp. NPDC097643 TaxID=3157230 RepID=UPI003321E67E